jgi:hypothetical protein
LRRYGQLNFATILGAMFQNAIIPLGVEGGTRSRAADRIMTYRTITYENISWYAGTMGYSPLLIKPNRKKERLRRKRCLRCPENEEDESASQKDHEKGDAVTTPQAQNRDAS